MLFMPPHILTKIKVSPLNSSLSEKLEDPEGQYIFIKGTIATTAIIRAKCIFLQP